MVGLIPATPYIAPHKPKLVKPTKMLPPKAPPITNPGLTPNRVINPIASPPLQGNAKRPTPQIIAIKAPPLTGTGRLPSQQNIGSTPPPISVGNQQPPMVVTATPSPTLTGQGKAPRPVGTTSPPLTGIGRAPQQLSQALVPPPITGGNQIPPLIIKPLATPIIVGQGKVPGIVATTPPPITGYGKVPGNRPAILAPPATTPATPPQAAQTYMIPPKANSGSSTPPPLKSVKVPHRAHQKPAPQQPSTPNPNSVLTAPPTTGQSGSATHWIVSAHPRQLNPSTQLGAQQLQGEVVEPGIHNREVTVYRSEDAKQVAYKDAIPMDKTGFFLTVEGIREPHFQLPKAQLPTVTTDHYVFFFDYASTEIYREQLYQIDAIVSYYQTTGKRIIVMGETDGFGSQEFNTQLAIHRSNKIIDRLTEAGVPVDAIELKVLVRCCRVEAATDVAVAATEDQRITWVSFQE